MEDLYDVFHRHFTIVRAMNGAMIDIAYRLRYQIYCVENQFEDASEFPDQREYDIYDQRAVHSLIKDNHTNSYSGVVRLILPDEKDCSVPFPIEVHCGKNFFPKCIKKMAFPRHSMAEISRFSISKKYKRRISESKSPLGMSDRAVYTDKRHGNHLHRLIPQIPIGLFTACVKMAADSGITHWYAVMEPSFIRWLKQFGIVFHPIGPIANYHGMRVPCYTEIDEMMSGIYRKRQDVWAVMSGKGRVWPLNACN
jgi:N-acyl amino acid synthase of PEP-CTERM/exosortase system